MSRGTAKDVAAVVSAAGEIIGRTRLQKTVSLLEMAGVGYGFVFDYYKFGPFSDDLVVSIERAVDLDYVEEHVRRANWGGIYSKFSTRVHRLTGVQARDELIVLARDADAVALELAVTAGFLAREGVTDPWKEVRARKPEKADNSHLTKAKALYQKFRQVKGIPNPLPEIA
jgi:hypothetical protein